MLNDILVRSSQRATGIFGSGKLINDHSIVSLHSCWHGLVSLGNLQKMSSVIDMSHESWKNVTDPHRVSQLTTSCLCDHRVTVLEVAGVSAVECVPLLSENRILCC